MLRGPGEEVDVIVERTVQCLRVGEDELVMLFISPPWGEALDPEVGLDLRRTAPPVAEIIDLAT